MRRMIGLYRHIGHISKRLMGDISLMRRSDWWLVDFRLSQRLTLATVRPDDRDGLKPGLSPVNIVY
jgi:hypothetical protein